MLSCKYSHCSHPPHPPCLSLSPRLSSPPTTRVQLGEPLRERDSRESPVASHAPPEGKRSSPALSPASERNTRARPCNVHRPSENFVRRHSAHVSHGVSLILGEESDAIWEN